MPTNLLSASTVPVGNCKYMKKYLCIFCLLHVQHQKRPKTKKRNDDCKQNTAKAGRFTAHSFPISKTCSQPKDNRRQLSVDHNDFIENQTDEVIESWGLPVNNRGHVPFYRQLYYPDVYELRACGYDIKRFEELFDLLENAKISHARKIHSLLHVEFSSKVFDPEIAREYELNVWATLHRFGASDAPPKVAG